jgi:hypothetical protein
MNLLRGTLVPGRCYLERIGEAYFDKQSFARFYTAKITLTSLRCAARFFFACLGGPSFHYGPKKELVRLGVPDTSQKRVAADVLSLPVQKKIWLS